MRYKNNKYKDNGIAVRTRIPRRDAEVAATAWSEGRKSLKELLQYCIENKICTMACCAGHDEVWKDEESGEIYEDYSHAYISFSLKNKATSNAMLPLFSEMMSLDGIWAVVFSTYETNGTIDFTVHIDPPLEDYVFDNILITLKRIKEGQKIELDPMVKSVYDTITGLDRRKVEKFFVAYHWGDYRKGMYQVKEKGEQKEKIDREFLSQEEIIQLMEEMQKNSELFKVNRKSALDNIYQFCIDQKTIIYNRLLDIRWENKQEKEKRQKVDEDRSQ